VIAAIGFQEMYYTPACPPAASADIGVERECRPAVVDILLRFGLAFGIALGYVFLWVFGVRWPVLTLAVSFMLCSC
jgi:hypothetical protein